MRTLGACSLGGAGHFNPLLPFLTASYERGDEVSVAGPPAIQNMVEEAGFVFEPGGEPSEAEVAAIRERLPILPAAEGSLLGNRELFGRLATRAMLPGMQRIFEDWSPRLVLRDPAEYASAILVRRTVTPVAQIAISFADVEAGSISVAAPVLEAHEPGLVDALMTTPYLSQFPPSLDPSVFPTTVRFRAQVRPSPEPLPAWWGERDGPLVYVSLGTVLGYMANAAGVYRAALRAVEHLPVRVLLTVGRVFDRSTLGPVPGHAHVEAWVEQDRVLECADLVVTHCGSGTALGALAHGVPIVAVPLFADQFENSRRIATAGAGLIIHGRRDEDANARALVTEQNAPDFAAAIETVLSDRSYRRAAGRIAADIADLPTANEVLTQLASTR